MVRTVGIGVIGMGWMGQVHSRSYLELRHRFQESDIRPRLVICADDAEDRALAGHERFGFERYTTDWREVVADPDVDAVSITAPMNVHLDVIRAAAEAGKHILCEKPVGRYPDETAEAERLARKAGVITRVGFNYRLAPVVQYALGLLRDGRLGEMTHYSGRFLVGYGSDPRTVLSWRFQRELAGLGTLGDLMSHLIDMTLMLAGPVTRVVAKQRKYVPRRPVATPGEGSHFSKSDGGVMGDVTNEDSVWALVEFANGAYGTLEGCRVIKGAKSSLSFDLHGTKGAASWDFLRMNELELFVPDDESGVHDGHTRIRSGEEHSFHADFYPGNSQGLAFEELKAIEAFQFLISVVEGRQGAPGRARIRGGPGCCRRPGRDSAFLGVGCLGGGQEPEARLSTGAPVMKTRLSVFLDDGGVMNDNAARGAQWQRLLGEFLAGGEPELWAEFNRATFEQVWRRNEEGLGEAYVIGYERYLRDWLRSMCDYVGVAAPRGEARLKLAREASTYVTRRVHAEIPGAVDTIRELDALGYHLYTASGADSEDLEGYVEAMDVRDLFVRLYGPDLVDQWKNGPEFYLRVFSDAGVEPDRAVVVDANPGPVLWASEAGAIAVLVHPNLLISRGAHAVVRGLAELPAVLETLTATGS